MEEGGGRREEGGRREDGGGKEGGGEMEEGGCTTNDLHSADDHAGRGDPEENKVETASNAICRMIVEGQPREMVVNEVTRSDAQYRIRGNRAHIHGSVPTQEDEELVHRPRLHTCGIRGQGSGLQWGARREMLFCAWSKTAKAQGIESTE